MAVIPKLGFIAVVSAVAVAAGCTANTWEKISPNSEGYWDHVEAVTSAGRRDDGSIVVCVIGRPAAVPPFVGDRQAEAFSLVLSAEIAGLVAIDAHPYMRRYRLTKADVAGPCQGSVADASAVPVHTFRHGDLGYPEGDRFNRIPTAVGAFIEHRASPPAVYVFMTNLSGNKTANIVYAATEARFDGGRAVLIQPGQRPVKGKPGYIAALPVTVVVDVLLLPVYLYMVAVLADAQ
ncbi:MAG: hypothetical protein OEU46_21995 [Alphaproteobacteria bacterium]|nr:hypothetical protein [Alphaproteobacteria bacterium]